MIENKNVIFISGTNRGIGLELSIQLAKKGNYIIAGYRNEDTAKKLFDEAERTENIFPIKVDVRNIKDLENLYGFIDSEFGRLDILINSAGVNINPSSKINDVTWSEISESIEINLGGPFFTSKILYPLIKKGISKKIINISSIMGSIKLSNGNSLPYRISKAGLNMLMKNQAVEYQHDEIISVSIHPGWVKTDMGGDSATMTVEESSRKIISIIENLSLRDSGEFISVNGDFIPF